MAEKDHTHKNACMEYRHPKLTAFILSLPFSDDFKSMANSQDFRTLGDMLNWPVSALLMQEGFTYHHYWELWAFLRDEELLIELRRR